MLSIINVVAPIFVLIAVGYLAVRFKLYPQRGVSGLISFVNNFATPCLLFESMLNSDFRSVFNPSIIVPFFIGAFACLIAGSLIARRYFRSEVEDAVSSGFAATFTNTLLVGYPIISRAYGDAALPTVFSIIGLHSPILLTVAMVLMELVKRDGASLGRTLMVAGKRIATNPLIWGITAGIIGNFMHLQPPEAATAFFVMMGQAVVPVALFSIGGALNEYKLSDNWAQALTMTVLKLVVHPLIAYVLMIHVLHVDLHIARYGILLAAMPNGINSYVFATYYNRGESVAASTLLLGTIGSAITVSIWLAILGP